MDVLGMGIDYDHVCNWLATHHPAPTVPPLPSSGHPHSSTSPLPVIPHPPPVATHPPSASQPPVPLPIFSASSPVVEPSKGAHSSTWDYEATAQFDVHELEMILCEDIKYQFLRWPHETDDAYEKRIKHEKQRLAEIEDHPIGCIWVAGALFGSVECKAKISTE